MLFFFFLMQCEVHLFVFVFSQSEMSNDFKRKSFREESGEAAFELALRACSATGNEL